MQVTIDLLLSVVAQVACVVWAVGRVKTQIAVLEQRVVHLEAELRRLLTRPAQLRD